MAYGACMEVTTTGTSTGDIHALNDDGVRLIDELSLDGEKITTQRRLIIESIRSHEMHDRRLFLIWMGFPEDLPDLLGVHPQPASNSLPAGILQSWFARKIRGELPEIFE